MRLQSLLRTSNTWRVGLIVLAIVASLVAGGSHLIYASPFSPLIVGGAVGAIAIGMAWLRKPVWALYAAIFVVFLPEGLTQDYIHSILNRALLLIALGVWLLDAVTRRRRMVWTSTALLMLGFLIWSAVTLFWTSNLGVGMERLAQYALRLLLFLLLVANEIDTPETLDGLMRTLALAGWVVVLVSVGTVLSGGYEPGTRLSVLGMNENSLGDLIPMTMPGVLWQVMRASERQRALSMSLSVVFIVLALIFVALSGSRGGAISLFTTLLALWFWKPTRPWGKLGLLILAVAAISAPFIFSTTLERFAGRQGDTLLGGREAIWQATWWLIRDHFWCGVGIGNAPHAVMPHLGMLTKLYGREWRAIHNPVLAIWAETGIPGLLLYLGVLGSAVWLFVRQHRQRSGTGLRSLAPYFALVSSAFAGYMLSWIKGGGMEYNQTYFLMLALLLIPSHLDIDGVDCITESDVQNAGRGRP